MPFITPEDRKKMKNIYCHSWIYNDKEVDITVGDRCYFFYKDMVEKFKHNRK